MLVAGVLGAEHRMVVGRIVDRGAVERFIQRLFVVRMFAVPDATTPRRCNCVTNDVDLELFELVAETKKLVHDRPLKTLAVQFGLLLEIGHDGHLSAATQFRPAAVESDHRCQTASPIGDAFDDELTLTRILASLHVIGWLVQAHLH